jgi:dihydroxy-acid dehydratase
LVRTGDVITLDVPRRRLEVHLEAAELERRRASWLPNATPPARGYAQLYFEHVLQADVGADFDFLAGTSGAAVPRDST